MLWVYCVYQSGGSLMNEQHCILYRGFSGPHFGINYIFNNPYLGTPRQPRHLPMDKYFEIDEWFIKNFKTAYWSTALFATWDINAAQTYAGDYGAIGILEPVDEPSCSICWSHRYADLFSELQSRPHASIADVLDAGEYEVFSWQDEQKRRESVSSRNGVMVHAPSFRVTKWISHFLKQA